MPPAGQILPFPALPPAVRLARAFAQLAEAQEAQRAAVAEWRAELSGLHKAVAGLEASMETYRAGLDRLNQGVAALGAETQRTVALLS